jgi:D-glycero-alpha-D-manno-heptose 1-phosphate guanylyltransferase
MITEKKGPDTSPATSLTCIILAGGLGTRLRSAVPDLPKCMAPVADKPFLQHVIDYAQKNGVTNFIFSLGYKHDAIEHFLQEKYPGLIYQSVIEKEPLGTGGGIQLALQETDADDVLVLNGDTLFDVPLRTLISFHRQHQSACTLALKPMKAFDRYGVVEIDESQHIRAFNEKKYYEQGLINGGVYALNRKAILDLQLPEKFSFEKDYLEKYYLSERMFGLVEDSYFIDIGIPEDFERAGRELS